ncbi:metastasis suppressor protein 1-like isoform X1 [Cynoglossus semilaevis]|uniref:MTSS I-BAR domain containing 1 n=1 Tax=Cynoglossus semilaevis TaxID=244447 RepID=A0A3P8UV01_CYNSE|nr:metastasis suppressor protein 1-like isoform X1 [Cynoglossus semilaevis]
MEAVIEKECSALGGLFQTVIADMKSSYPIWEDFITKAGKLQSQLRATAVAVAAFLDAFQKVADLATNSRGGTRDIGSALTRMCMRHRSIEAKVKQFSMGFLECLINPLQEQMEEWKRGVNTLDKDHAKEYKRARQEIKKKSSDTLKLQKKAKKADNLGRGDIQPQLDSAMQDVSDKYILLEETEKQALRKALIEERQRFCCFVAMLRPVVDEEISMLGEVTHLQAISDDLKALTSDPHKLPPASEQVILDLKGSDYGWSYQTPPSSPSTTMSRKSSMCSSLNSVNSSDSRGSSGSHSHSPSSSSSSSSSNHLFHHHHPRHRYRSSTLPQQTPARLSSISSHDSGFISSSQDQYMTSKSSSPMPAETKPCPGSSSSEVSEPVDFHIDCSSPSPLAAATAPQHTDKLTNGYDHYSPVNSPTLHSNGLGSVSSTAFPFFPPSSSCSTSTSTSCPTRSWSRPASAVLPDYPSYCTLGSPMMPSSRVPSWKDWAKPGPYDQPMVNTLRRKKDKETPTVVDTNGHLNGDNNIAPLGSASISNSTPARAALQTPSSLTSVEDRSRAMAAPLQAGDIEAHEELALALSRGLELDTQRSSRDSIQCSSGYSTQTNTPCCSEDTIPSQVSDYDYFSMAGDQEPEPQQPDFDKSSTIPRNSDISQSYRRMFQTKRPASTAGLPSPQTPYPGQGPYPTASYPQTPVHTGAYPSTPTGPYPTTPTGCSSQGYFSGSTSHNAYGSYSTGHGPVIVTPGVATIRRTPSSKPTARRSASVGGTGPIPIRTPMVPVKIPTVPDTAGAFNGSRNSEVLVGAGGKSPDSPTYAGGEDVDMLPMMSWSGQATTNPPTVLPIYQSESGPQQGGGGDEEETGDFGGGNMLVAIRKGVKLKRTLTNDRSAPRIA